MPIVRIEFRLPDEENEYRVTMMANRLCSAIHEIEGVLRQYRKYTEMTDEQRKFFNGIDTELCDIIADLPERI